MGEERKVVIHEKAGSRKETYKPPSGAGKSGEWQKIIPDMEYFPLNSEPEISYRK